MSRAIISCSHWFADAALYELRRSLPEVTLVDQPAPGVLLIEFPYSFDKLTLPWRRKPPIYLHHAFPVHHIVSLQNNPADLPRLRQLIRTFAPSDAVVQVRSTVDDVLKYSPADLHCAVAPDQPLYPLNPPTGRVVSIVLTGSNAVLKAYAGISWASQNLSPFAGGQIPFTQPVSNRAGFKLLEALTAFEIRLNKGTRVLDLGAAPGAWTTLLRQRGMRVTAVAPKPLYPWLMVDPNVEYQPTLAETYLDRCTATYDLIVNDMILEGQESARLMVGYAEHLRSGGIAIMTLKLHGHNRQKIMDHAMRLLRKEYKIIRVRQLVSNRREVTLFLRRKE